MLWTILIIVAIVALVLFILGRLAEAVLACERAAGYLQA